MAQTNLGGQDPLALIRMLMTQIAQPQAEPDFSSATSYVDKLTQQAESMRAQANQLLQAPEPDTSHGDMVQRALAGAADSLTGGNQLGAANERIHQTKAERTTQRLTNLKLLADSYNEAADRAAKAGDMVEEQKLRAKVESLHNRREQLHQLLEGATAMQKAQDESANRTAENQRAAGHDRTQKEVASIYANARESGKLDKLEQKDPVKAALFKNILNRAADVAKNRDALATKTDKKGRVIVTINGKAKAQLAALDKEYETYLNRARDIFATVDENAPSTPPAPAAPTLAEQYAVPPGVSVSPGSDSPIPAQKLNVAVQAMIRARASDDDIRADYQHDPRYQQLGITLPQLLTAVRKARNSSSSPSAGGAGAPRSN